MITKEVREQLFSLKKQGKELPFIIYKEWLYEDPVKEKIIGVFSILKKFLSRKLFLLHGEN